MKKEVKTLEEVDFSGITPEYVTAKRQEILKVVDDLR